MKKALFSALTLALLYDAPARLSNPKSPRHERPAPKAPGVAAGRGAPGPAAQVDLSKRSVSMSTTSTTSDEYAGAAGPRSTRENRGKKMLIQATATNAAAEYNIALGNAGPKG